MADATEARAFEEVSGHPRFADLVTLARGVALRAVAAKELVWKSLAETAPEAERGTLTPADTETDFGNAWGVLERGPKTSHERALARALWGHAVAEARPSSSEGENDLAAQVSWLAANTPFDATVLLDRALGDGADAFWPAMAERLQRLDAGEIGTSGRAESVAIAMALRASRSTAAQKELHQLASRITDPVVLGLLGDASPSEPPELTLKGEVRSPPRHPALTVVLALTGILLAAALARLVLRLVFAFRRPAELTVSSKGVRVHWRVLVLGRLLRDRELVIPRGGLVRAMRDVRYSQLPFYAGLFALAVGSLVGVHIFVDGVRSASPSLLLVGLVVVAAGVGLDFALATLAPSLKGRCRVLFVPQDGRAVCVGDLDGPEADAAFAWLAKG